MATLVGLEYMKNREQARHNKATEYQAERDRLSREGIASADRFSKEKISSLDRLSKESIAAADRASKENISSLDRTANTENSRYTADMRYLGNAKDPIVNMVMPKAIMTDRIAADTWGSQQTTSPLRDLVTSTIRTTDEPVQWVQKGIQQVADETVQFLQPLLDPDHKDPGPIVPRSKRGHTNAGRGGKY